MAKKPKVEKIYTRVQYERALDLVEEVQNLGEVILDRPFDFSLEKLEILRNYREYDSKERGITIGPGKYPIYHGRGKNSLTYDEIEELIMEDDGRTKVKVNHVLASYYKQALNIIESFEKRRTLERKLIDVPLVKIQQPDLFQSSFSGPYNHPDAS